MKNEITGWTISAAEILKYAQIDERPIIKEKKMEKTKRDTRGRILSSGKSKKRKGERK